MFFNCANVPSRRREQSSVSCEVSLLEYRTLLSGNAIYPQAATPTKDPTVAATKANFTGAWDLTIEGEFPVRLTLNQSGSVVTGTIEYMDGGPTQIPVENGSAVKKTLSIHGDLTYVQVDFKLKLKKNDTLKGTYVSSFYEIKQKVTGIKV